MRTWSRTPTLILALALPFVLSSCVGGAPQEAPSPSPSISAPPSTPPVPSQTPQSAGTLTVSLDDVTFSDGNRSEFAALDNGPGVIELLTTHFGRAPEKTRDPADAKYVFPQTYYTWDGVRLTVPDGGGRVSISVQAPQLNGVGLSAQGGVAVGMSRSEALEHGAESWEQDAEDDDQATRLVIGPRPVANTQSLSHPGSVGSEFIDVWVENGTVKGIQAPGNDFSDL